MNYLNFKIIILCLLISYFLDCDIPRGEGGSRGPGVPEVIWPPPGDPIWQQGLLSSMALFKEL